MTLTPTPLAAAQLKAGIHGSNDRRPVTSLRSARGGGNSANILGLRFLDALALAEDAAAIWARSLQ